MMRTVWTAHCIVCDWTAQGDPATVDLAARKHTGEGPYGKKPGPKHATATMGLPG